MEKGSEVIAQGEGELNRSHRAFLLAGYGFVPLALGIGLPFVGADANLALKGLGLSVALIGILLWGPRGENGPTTPLRWIVALSILAYASRLAALGLPEVKWVAWFSSAAELAWPIAYFLLAQCGIALAHSLGDVSLERSWRHCKWIGLPLMVLPALALFAWRVASGFHHALKFESGNLMLLMGSTLVLSLPAVLLVRAVFATHKAARVASGTAVRLPLRVLAHPATAVAIVFLLLTPSLMLVPYAIHYALTPGFDEFVTRNRSASSFELPAGIRVLERHSGPVYATSGWIDIDEEDGERKAERIGYDFSLKLTRPDATLLDATHSLDVAVDPMSYQDFLELRVASTINVDPRFRLALTMLVDRRGAAPPGEPAVVPALKFMLRAALLAGPGESTLETVFVDGLESLPRLAAETHKGALDYVWQARGAFELVPLCREKQCLGPRVRFEREQRFDLTTEEYSYEMKAVLAMKSVTRGPGSQSSLTVKSDSSDRSQKVSWNDVPW